MAKTILAVDDSVSMRQVVSFALRAAGYDVVEASDGKDAVAKLFGPVHMVITDLNMPVMDGIDLIKHIRTKSAHKHIPILMLTTESQPAKKEAAKAATEPAPPADKPAGEPQPVKGGPEGPATA